MGYHPEMAVFRKFRTLNMLRLLEMQSELVQQEQDYHYIFGKDAELDCSISRSYAKDWDKLNESLGKGGTFQRDTWRKLRKGLELYSKAAS